MFRLAVIFQTELLQKFRIELFGSGNGALPVRKESVQRIVRNIPISQFGILNGSQNSVEGLPLPKKSLVRDVHKSVIAEPCIRARKYVRKVVAAGKGTFIDVDDAGRECDACQSAAIREGKTADFCNTLRNSDAR